MASNPDLSSFSTKAARSQEQHRRKTRQRMLAHWQRLVQTLTADSAARIADIPAAMWDAADKTTPEAERAA